jgi:small subunit ribosomal protein S16
MVSIKLSRVGTKNQPSFRVIVVDKQKDPWGKSIEIVGHYNPRRNPRELMLKADRVKHWLAMGAEASDTVWNLLVDEKIVEGKKRNVTHISHTRAKAMADEKAKSAPKAEATPAETAAA